jgi:cysteine-rich repeat protein
MNPPRTFALLGGLFLAACSLFIQNIGVDRCDTEGQILCADDQTQLECLDGLQKLTACNNEEICIDGVGCPICGNNITEGNEACDGKDLKNCSEATEEALPEGVTACNADCTIDLDDCSLCGNERAEGSEECDDDNQNNNDACNNQCKLNAFGCFVQDNNAQLGELCDGDDLDNKACTDLGFAGGDLRCNNQCGFDTSNCTQQ